MSGISKSFKVPTLIKRKKNHHGLPEFTWRNISNLRELGVGSFGSVHIANYGVECKKVVVKKLRGESDEAKRRFLKEAEMLNKTKHQNIPKFLGYSDNPHGLMMEYVAFDFGPFGFEKMVSSLDDFYHFVDSEFSFESFADVLPVCLQDIVKGLHYLHQMQIAHRDLKPSNVLVSNQHYCNKDKETFTREYEHSPIVCKVADFGLSRSLDTQTLSIVQSRTDDICRGTPVFMAPEIHMELLTSATQYDLQKTDIWSLGLLAYSLVNPNLANPYRKESEDLGHRFSMETMKQFMQSQQLPSHDEKYESFRVALWWQIDDVFSICAKFDPKCRPQTAEILSRMENQDASLVKKQLGVSQSTVLEKNDMHIAQQLHLSGSRDNTDLSLATVSIDDGTISCTFLAIKLCDMFF